MSGIIRGASTAALVNGVGVGVVFGLHVLLSRLMGVEHYGVYVYVLGWINILVLFGKMGLDIALLRYVAAYTAREERGALAGILRRSFSLALGVAVGLSVAGALVVWVLRERLTAELAWTFWAGFGLLPMLALAHLRQSALRALRRIARAQLPDLVVRPVLLGLLMVGGVYGLGLPARGQVAMALDLVATTVALLLGSAWLYRALPGNLKGVQPSYRTREWVAAALPLFLTSGMNLVHRQTDVLMVGSLLGAREAGIYAVAARVSALVLFGFVAVNAIAAPMISGLYAKGQMDELQHMVSLAAKGILGVALPVVLGLVIWGAWVLSFFGPDFPGGYCRDGHSRRRPAGKCFGRHGRLLDDNDRPRARGRGYHGPQRGGQRCPQRRPHPAFRHRRSRRCHGHDHCAMECGDGCIRTQAAWHKLERLPAVMINKRIIANCFIVGRPECGATALYAYLRGHPKILTPEVK